MKIFKVGDFICTVNPFKAKELDNKYISHPQPGIIVERTRDYSYRVYLAIDQITIIMAEWEMDWMDTQKRKQQRKL